MTVYTRAAQDRSSDVLLLYQVRGVLQRLSR